MVLAVVLAGPVGQYVGQLQKVGNKCKGRSGVESISEGDANPWSVRLHIDEQCRVSVASITRE
jgi:hypothetical protein